MKKIKEGLTMGFLDNFKADVAKMQKAAKKKTKELYVE